MPEARAPEVAEATVAHLAALDAALTGDGGNKAVALQPDTLALFAYAGGGPLGGVGDLVDWRLCGRIGQAQARGLFQGHADDQLLLPAPARLGVGKVFVFGLGPKEALTPDALAARLEQALAVVAQAGGRRLAWAVPPGPHPPLCPDPAAVFEAQAATTNGHIIGKLLQPPLS